MSRVLSLLPESRLFRFKAFLWRRLGRLDVDPNPHIYSSVRFHTYPIHIGARTHVGPLCLFTGANGTPISIGDNFDIGPLVTFLTGTHELGSEHRRAGRNTAIPVSVNAGIWIGARATILPGVVIGKGCVIAAGSVVTRSIPDNSLAAGVPAVVKRALASTVQGNPGSVHEEAS